MPHQFVHHEVHEITLTIYPHSYQHYSLFSSPLLCKCIAKYLKFMQAWKHGAKILIIVGEDDKQVHPKWHSYFYDKCPEVYKSNVQMYRYLGAGHMIEPPYTPHIRSIDPGKKRLQTIFFIPEKYYGEYSQVYD